ncbi:MAG: MarR family transcriptional regulator [Pseudomonadota bacterium]
MTMLDTPYTNTLRILQASDEIKARLSGEFSAVHGISVNEFLMLLHLESAPKHRLARVELAKRLHVSASTVTRMAAPLEKIGLLAREIDERDARLSFVVLTEAAHTKVSEAKATLAKQAGYLFQDRWSEDELEQLSRFLQRLLAGSLSTLA